MPRSATHHVPRSSVRSSSLASIGYSAELRVLDVEFRGGEVYRFFMVPTLVHRELLASASIGACFNRVVRDRFPMERLPSSPSEPNDLLAELGRSLAERERAPPTSGKDWDAG